MPFRTRALFPTLFGLILLTLVASIYPADVAAHAALDRSEPPAGTVLPESPSVLTLWFTEPLETAFTGADLLDATGAPVDGVTTAISAEDTHLLVVTTPALADGAYTVAWRTLSSADGHTLEGYFGFSVGATGSSVTGASVMPADQRARELTRGLALIGQAALLAFAPITLWVLDPVARSSPELARSLPGPLRSYAVVATTLALLGSVAALAAQAVTIAPDRSLPEAISQTLAETRYGQIWVWRISLLAACGALIAGALWGTAHRRRPLLFAATAVSLAMPIPFSLLSHAAAQTEGRAAAIAADVLHLLLASVWAGGLFMFVLVFVPALRPLSPDQRRYGLRIALPRFSVVGIAAWGVLVLSGLYSAWLQVGTIAALCETDYGQTLLLKSSFLLPVLALAAFHFVVGQRGVPAGGARRFARTVVLEAGLVILVLLVVGRLIGLEPARETMAGRIPSVLDVPVLFATDTAVRNGRLAISPGAAGVNTFTLLVEGEALPERSEGVLRFAPVGPEIGEQELRLPLLAQNRFEATGDELALAGEWRLTTIVREIGAFSWTSEAVLSIGLQAPAAPAANPAPIFGQVGVAGLVMIALGMAAVAVALVAGNVTARHRHAFTVGGVMALAVGAVVLAGSQIPPAVNVEALEVAALVTPEPAPTASPESEHAQHEAGHHPPATPERSRLAAAGTPVAINGLTATLEVTPVRAGPVDLVLTVADENGEPLTGANVAISWEMPGMGDGRAEATAEEVAPGRYQAAAAHLDMGGEWKVSARISPKQQPTRIVLFAVEMR